MKSRSEIKNLAKERFYAKYWPAVGLLALYALIVGVSEIPTFFMPGFGSLASIFVGTVVAVGIANVFLKVWRVQEYGIADLFHPFSQYWRNLGGMMWMTLKLFLWMLIWLIPFIIIMVIAIISVAFTSAGLFSYGYGYGAYNPYLYSSLFANAVIAIVFICSFALMIPAIVKSYAYFMTPYILATHPNVRATQAVALSEKMMYGHKGRLFVTQLSFIGWFLLCGLTFGVLYIFYVGPYYSATMAGYFDEIKDDALRRGVLTQAELDGVAIPAPAPQNV